MKSLVLAAIAGIGSVLSAAALADDAPPTATPIKHVIIIIGENRSFDHLFGLYRPKPGQPISNLLSKGILNADGSPGPHFADAAQAAAKPDGHYFISAPSKTPYANLPPPDLAGTANKGSDQNPAPGYGYGTPMAFATDGAAAALERDLLPSDIHLMTTGATGLATRQGPDTRVTNATALPNGPFRLTGPNLPYDAYTGDTVHRFFQMWQQSDCSAARATKANPGGCLNDLYPWVATTSSKTFHGGGSSMGVYDMSAGDAPYFKQLADTYTLADNYHQASMGGTMIEHHFLGTGDAIFYSDGRGKAVVPPKQIANPEPMAGTANQFTVDGGYMDCSDRTQPGIAPILDYLAALPKPLKSNCEPGHYYVVNNLVPSWVPDGSTISGEYVVPPSNVRTIGDALAERHISFAYFGGGFTATAQHKTATYCPICNPFGYSVSMNAPASRRAHFKDVQDFVADINAGTLPAVSYVKPDGWLDGHPQSSKVDLLEAFARNLIPRIEANPKLFAETAIFMTFDESGGYWDSGYMQPLDFFGDGPRIPTIAISPYSKGGRVVHTYYDHVSILKFIERNWGLPALTRRSRDRLPNPKTAQGNPYVPVNGPAIGDLFEMFDFKDKH
ncbi:MAG TPA: alkaline phosphatase family protein [Magnetospirillaceae bacterium]